MALNVTETLGTKEYFKTEVDETLCRARVVSNDSVTLGEISDIKEKAGEAVEVPKE
jgi:hypothetical protein